MRDLARVIQALIFIPNLPFFIVLAVYVLHNINKHTGPTEMNFIDNNNLMNDKIIKHINKIYPKRFRYVLAFIFYLWIMLNILQQTILT
jgi:hypothetical protein